MAPVSRKAGVTAYPCGCSHDVHAWLELCAKHEAEWIETHTRWSEEKRNPPTYEAVPQ